MPTSSRTIKGRAQSGFMLLEVLVSILIFSIGVLSIVGLQANSIKQSSAAKYRTDASLLANDLIGRMWVSDRSNATLSAAFTPGGDEYARWQSAVENALLGADAHPPTVVVDPDNLVTVTVLWKAPNEPPSDPPHQLVVVTKIK